MERVTGLEDRSFRAADPLALARWFRGHLGVAMVPEDDPNGRFARLDDPQGDPVEAWEPRAPGRL